MAMPKRKLDDTATLLSEAQASLQAIAGREAELDEKRLDVEPAESIKIQIELAAARKDAERRIALLNERAAAEVRARQAKSQLALIGRVEEKFKKSDEAGVRLQKLIGEIVVEFRKMLSARADAAMAWQWEGNEATACLFGTHLVSAVAGELYRQSGQPYLTATAPRSFEFPGAKCFSMVDRRPESVKPLVERLAEATGYATKRMRGAPLRNLPPPTPAPTEVKPAVSGSANVQAAPEIIIASASDKPPQPDYVWSVRLVRPGTNESRIETIKFSPEHIAECHGDNLGATGPIGRELAIRLALDRTSDDFILDATPGAVTLDLKALERSFDRDRT